MLIGRGFPQQHHFLNLSVTGIEAGPDQTGRPSAAYPHLWITLWITEPTPEEGFAMVDRNFPITINRLHEEAPCG